MPCALPMETKTNRYRRSLPRAWTPSHGPALAGQVAPGRNRGKRRRLCVEKRTNAPTDLIARGTPLPRRKGHMSRPPLSCCARSRVERGASRTGVARSEAQSSKARLWGDFRRGPYHHWRGWPRQAWPRSTEQAPLTQSSEDPGALCCPTSPHSVIFPAVTKPHPKFRASTFAQNPASASTFSTFAATAPTTSAT